LHGLCLLARSFGGRIHLGFRFSQRASERQMGINVAGEMLA
jgi:hypothetical protein